jgi:hypothetical protein
MDAFLPEAMVGRQFDFNGHNLTDHGYRHGGGVFPAPGDQDPGPADVLGVHRTPHPERRRGDIAPKLDIDSRALAPVNGFHHRGSPSGNLARKRPVINIVNGLYRVVAEGYQRND